MIMSYFGGVRFPGVIHVHLGDPVLNPAHNLYEIKVASVKANGNVLELQSRTRCGRLLRRRFALNREDSGERGPVYAA
jgi:hypothetical protein